MLDFTLRGEPVRAQFAMNHRVMIATILILSYGIYVTANWRRAALILGSIAILPFATLMALYLRNRQAMGWLARSEPGLGETPLALLSFDAMLLLILAVGSTYGAFTISRLRLSRSKCHKRRQQAHPNSWNCRSVALSRTSCNRVSGSVACSQSTSLTSSLRNQLGDLARLSSRLQRGRRRA